MKYLLLIVGLLSLSRILNAQQTAAKTTFYRNYWSEEVPKDAEVADRVERYALAPQTRLDSVFSFATGRLRYVETIDRRSDGDTLTTITKWRSNGNLFYTNESSGWKKPVTQLSYDKDGKLKRKTIFSKGKTVSTQCYDAAGIEIVCTGTEYTERMPEFPGGNNRIVPFIAKSITYPAKALKKRQQGIIHLRFVVDETGQIRDVRVEKSLFPELDAEAVRAGKAMPRFAPGMQNEEPVSVSFTVPVTFKIN